MQKKALITLIVILIHLFGMPGLSKVETVSANFSGDVIIPSTITEIPEGAFYNCTELTSVTFEGDLTSIPAGTFSGCTNLQSVNLPKTVKSIGERAFEGCSSLKGITIPDSVTSIGKNAFKGCNKIECMTMPKDVYGENEASRFGFLFGYEIGAESSRNGYPAINEEYTKGNKIPSGKIYQNYTIIHSTKDNWDPYINEAFTNYLRGYYYYNIPKSLKKIEITNDTSIGFSTFYNCTNIEEIVLNKDIANIGAYAFYNCTNLKTVFFNGKQSDWNKITIGTGNEYLINATIHFIEEPSTYIIGDINGDGEVTTKDVTVLRRYIAGGYDVTVVDETLDVNKDGTITTKDVTTLRRFIAGGYGVEID